jgi:hypothetical protein
VEEMNSIIYILNTVRTFVECHNVTPLSTTIKKKILQKKAIREAKWIRENGE